MSDTEEVIIKRIKPVKDTKPEIAREKLKEKRLRLKAEKEAEIVEKAKQKYAEEQIVLKQKEAEENEKKNNDPMFLMMKKLEELQSQINNKPVEEVKPKRKTKKVVEVVEEVKPKQKVKKEVEVKIKPARKPKQIKEVVESPSNIFVGDNTPINIPNPEYITEFNTPTNTLQNILLSRRRGY